MDVAKTHEIMARFRPIAPRPTPLPDSAPAADRPATMALNLQSRPCRVRKRSRATSFRPVLPAPLLPFPELLHCSVPVERDLLKKLQQPKVIMPQPVRPVRSCISVGPIESTSAIPALPPASPAQVEEQVELERLPTVISDSNNRVRLANAAYKGMVGQPECPWLETIDGLSSKRISGEVILDLSNVMPHMPASSNSFSCWVKIEWATNNGEKRVLNAPCDVIPLHCQAKDYRFSWRFRTSEALHS